MNWEIAVIIFVILIIFVLIHFFFRLLTFRSLDLVLKKKNWNKLTKIKYVKKCYHFVGNHFVWESQCWLKYPWRNFYYRNIWNLKNKSIPCHIQNSLFQHCLLRKFNPKEIKNIFSYDLKQRIFVHFHTLIKLNGKWIDVDVHKRNDGVPFGKNIHTVKR